MCSYDLCTVTEDPIPSMEMHDQLFLRYQLNPYKPPFLPPPPGFENHIYRNQRPYLREVFVEPVEVDPVNGRAGLFSSDTMHTVCGINVYTKPTGIFSDFHREEGEDFVLIYSSIPKIPNPREKLLHPCDVIQRTAVQSDNAKRLHHIRSTQGWGAAADTALTEATLLSSRRIGAMPSSFVLYHHYRGTVSELTPTDLYGLPEDDPNVQPASCALAEKAVYGYELSMKNMGM
ncbi:hypothetical protein LSM04_001222 [Trypanosoma melophagium]|nr:hypothetical protein LSM04_001222 [Trypanosoma melophagium]